MKRVIIESPFRGENEYQRERNEKYARECMKDSIRRGEAPFLSHLLYTQVLDEKIPHERSTGISLGLVWGSAADCTVVYTDNGITEGMEIGIQHAKELGRPIEYRILPTRETGLSFVERLKLNQLMITISKFFDVPEEDIRGDSRLLSVVDARHIYCTVAKEMFPAISFGSIGKTINRQHCSVMHAIADTRQVVEKRRKYERFIKSRMANGTLCEPSLQ